MHRKESKGWMKHLDFMVLDIISLQLSFILSFWIWWEGIANPYAVVLYRFQAILLVFCQLVVMLFTNCYKNIIRRNKYQEFYATFRFEVSFMLLDILILFMIHQIMLISRMFTGIMVVMNLFVSYLFRVLNKRRIRSSKLGNRGRKSLILISEDKVAEEALRDLTGNAVSDYKITAVILLDRQAKEGETIRGVPCVGLEEDILLYVGRHWVDDVLICLSEGTAYPTELSDELLFMGITVHYNLTTRGRKRMAMQEVGKVGNFRVLTSSLRIVSARQTILKRLLDICGGIVGCILTGIIFIFIAPAIYIQSPGPIFFKQIRIGQNGKKFYMYKFRSMYMDAEKRKKALMEQNKMSGMMFKMDDDPRIIGSEKKDKNGRPMGIGNFIRRTSLDEFPQFWNVLKGDMSLVGTRPPTVDEWEQYDPHHRIRMSIKPGITGLWQISGRSDITDFEEVVRLDSEYIENWSFSGDIRIILKTIGVVLRHEGAE